MENSMNSSGVQTCELFENVYFEIDGSSVPYIVNAAINTPLFVVAAVANLLVFYAIRTTKSIHLPSKLLLCSLVLTDLGVSCFAQPLFVVFLIAKVERLSPVSCFCLTAYLFGGAMLGCVALMTMTAIGVDRFIAFHFHRRYRDIVTVRRVAVVIAVTWVFSAVFASTYHLSPKVYGALVFLVMFTCVVVTSGSYIKIYRGLRRHSNSYRVKGPAARSENSLNVSSFRKTASSMLWIYCLFLVCYVPYVCSIVAQRTLGLTVVLRCIIEYAVTILYFNSCLNPFVYCYRLNDIRAIVVKTLRKLCSPRFRCATSEQGTPPQSSTGENRTTDTEL